MGAFDSLTQCSAVVHGPEQDLRPSLAGNDVCRRSAGDHADIDGRVAEGRIAGKRQPPEVVQNVQQLLDGRFAQMRIGGVGRPPARADIHAQDALGPHGEPVLGRLTVDDEVRASGRAVRRPRTIAQSLLADQKQEREVFDAARPESLRRLHLCRQDPLRVTRASAVNEFSVLTGGDKGRHGVHVRAQYNFRRAVPGEDVRSTVGNRLQLDLVAALRQVPPQEFRAGLLAARHGINVHQRPSQFKEGHRLIMRQNRSCRIHENWRIELAITSSDASVVPTCMRQAGIFG